MVTLKIKQVTGQDTFPVETDLEGTVADLKAAVAAAVDGGTDPAALRLIYRGQILKDDKTLASYGGWVGGWVLVRGCWAGAGRWDGALRGRGRLPRLQVPPSDLRALPSALECMTSMVVDPRCSTCCQAGLAEDHVVHMVKSKQQQGGARCAACAGGRGLLGAASRAAAREQLARLCSTSIQH